MTNVGRHLWRLLGIAALTLGLVGAFVPLLPTVPFVLLAAFAFARSNPAWERRLLDHPRFGPPIRAWRETGSISRRGKALAVAAFAASGVFGLIALETPWRWLPAAVAMVGSTWILARPTVSAQAPICPPGEKVP